MFGVVTVILVKNNYSESIVYDNEAVFSAICFKHGKQAAFSHNYYILELVCINEQVYIPEMLNRYAYIYMAVYANHWHLLDTMYQPLFWVLMD